MLTCYEFVPGEVSIGSGAQENVGLVQQEHHVPELADHEGPIEGFLQFLRVGAKLSNAYGVEWHTGALCDCGLG